MAAETLVLLSQSISPEPVPRLLSEISSTGSCQHLHLEGDVKPVLAPMGSSFDVSDLQANDAVPDAKLSEFNSLDDMEADIDLKILNHVTGEDLEMRQRKFTKTVCAVQNIVTKKLYKEKSVSLEVYFKEFWKISRAQVYRFLDCATVLNQLDGFGRIPTRERLCRTLKCLAKTKSDLRFLWATCLSHMNGNPDAITSTLINSLWDDLVAKKKVLGLPDGQLGVIPEGYNEQSWDTHIEALVFSVARAWMGSDYTSTMLESSHANCLNDMADLEPPFRDVPRESTSWLTFPQEQGPRSNQLSQSQLSDIVDTLSSLEQKGMHLEYFLDGEWKSAQSYHWRINETESSSTHDEEFSRFQPILLTASPNSLSRPMLNKIHKSRSQRSKNSTSKKSLETFMPYDSAAHDSGEISRKAIPVAAEPPISYFRNLTGKRSIRPSASDPELTEEGGDNTDTELDCSSDYNDEVGSVKTLHHRKKSRKAKPRPASSRSGSTTVEVTPVKLGTLPLQPINETFADDIIETCWDDFAPEELEAVAVLQRYRSKGQMDSSNSE
ncbi:hypothetical protein BC830DRAFT_423699 [Chytriomyces sp. MP71]|nr:hypothetical protein BC830DRAFT_423699 [Chytriomyces sp. MP71]